jgi:hypothetical protein
MTLLPSPKLKIKTDNKSLGDKVAIRRLLISEAGLEPLRVLDLYAGDGHIWKELRRTPRMIDADHPRPLQVIKYTPIDAAAKQAGQIRMKISPRVIASLNGDDSEETFTGDGLTRYNVIDVDCFGDPFAIWQAVLFRIKTPTVVFLTRGRVTYGAGRMPISQLSKRVLGIPEEWDIPGKVELMELADKAQLLQECPTAHIEHGYVTRLRRVDYYGIFVLPDINLTKTGP